jgi:hypothetical protein
MELASPGQGASTIKEDVMRRIQGTAIGASLATALALCAAPALAADRYLGDEGNPDGFYLGGSIGDFNANLHDPNQVDNIDLDFGHQDADRLSAGWRFNRFVAVQLDYTDFGESNAAPNQLGLRAGSTGWTPAIVGTLPLGPIELFAKAGVLFYNVDFNSDANNLQGFTSDSGHDSLYGAGIGVTVIKRLNLSAEYERIHMNQFDDADAVWLNASWRF